MKHYRRRGLSYEEIIHRSFNRRSKSKTVCGYTFKLDKDLAEQLGVSPDFVYRHRRNGLSYEEIINRATNMSTNRTYKSRTICGYTFKSYKDLSLQLNKSETYVGRLKRKGLSYEEIIERATKE